ncbi:MAG: acetolactate synthase 3 large subunit [Pseudomonadota bacterium]|nr:acetolactate synthase 3 large subunit [Pseudomonadota bacterium]
MISDTKSARQPTEHLSGAEVIVKALQDQGVDVVFGYPGGAVLPLYDELFKTNKLRHILVRHEQAAVHAAEGYARSTGKIGVVLVTSGPGATNAVTGLTDALMDSIPIVCLTGQVPTHLIGTDAFQEADTTGITRACTKHNYLVKNSDELADVMHEAFYVAANGRPGPVVVDLPKDILFAEAPYFLPKDVRPCAYQPKMDGDTKKIEQAVELLANAERPIIYGGGGLINSGLTACKLLREFAELSGFPVTLTLMGLGAFPASNPNFLGMLGMHGTYEANLAMHHCDVMLNIGARFDDRVTGRIDAFSPNATKIHIDIDQSSINKNILADVPIVGDAERVLKTLIECWKSKKLSPKDDKLSQWWNEINSWRGKECLKFDQQGKIIKPQFAIKRLFEKTKDKEVFISTEVGQHQMWAAQYFGFDEPNRWMTSGGLGTMGYGLPAAMGTQIAHPDALVIDIAGDASILMNMQEFSTITQYRLPVKVFIINNQWMGMVRQWQELNHGSRYSQSYTESLPDFIQLAKAFGGTGMVAETVDQLDSVIDEMINSKTFFIADIRVNKEESCFPMIPSGAAHNEMILSAEDKEGPKTSAQGMALV